MLTTLAALVNPLLMVAMPLLLGIYFAAHLKADWRTYGLGMLTFVASQVLHIPFNGWVLAPLLKVWHLEPMSGSASLAAMAILLGLSAGVFEETARLVMLRGPLRESRNWTEGLMFGAGHGGMEAILLGLLSLYSFLQLHALRNVDLAVALSPAQGEVARSALQSYWSLTYYQHLIPALERAAALCLHLCLSILVVEALTRRNGLWFVIAVLWHAAVDAVAVFAMQTWGVYVAEALVALAGLLSVGIVLALRPGKAPGSPQAANSVPSPVTRPEPVASAYAPQSARVPGDPKNMAIDPEALERSRYQ